MKNLKKVIVITVEKYSDKTLKKNMKKEFVESGYDFEYWYIGNLHTYFGYSKDQELNNAEGDYRSFSSMNKLMKFIQKESNGFIAIIQFPINVNTEKLLTLIYKKADTMLSIDMNASLSSFGVFHDRKSHYISLIKNPKKLLFNIRNKFVYKRLLKKGIFNKIHKFQTGAKFDLDKSITFDDVYTYLEIKNKPRLIDNDYIVFVDVSLPNHIDFENDNLETMSSEIYYNKINDFFDKIEAKYGCEVVIAAHPKSNHTDEYKNRRVEYGKTAELIKDCKFVINHHSSTISFATLWKMPILFIYMNEFLNKETVLFSIYKRILFQSDYLKMKAINIDEIDMKDELINIVDEERYQEFISEYLISSEYPKTNFEVISKFIKE